MIKLAIREDRDGNCVRAYFSRMDDSERFEVASISLQLCRDVPGLFEGWKQLMTRAITGALEAQGVKVQGVEVIKPHQKG